MVLWEWWIYSSPFLKLRFESAAQAPYCDILKISQNVYVRYRVRQSRSATEKEQKEYDTEDKYEMFISKSQDLNIPVTPNVEAKIESQYGVSDLDTFLKDSKNQGKESQKEDSGGLTGEDKLAYEWAVNNPKDERAKAILTKLGK